MTNTRRKHKDAVIVICTRPESKRLPEKCFMRIGGRSVLEHIFERIAPLKMDTILAIPKEIDRSYRTMYMALRYNYKCKLYEGSSNSPLHRMSDALLFHYAPEYSLPKYIVRITHDDILIDAQTVELLLDRVRKRDATYGCTPEIIEGAGVEVIRTDILIAQAESIKTAVEHISYFVKGKKPIKVKPRESICRPYRLTLDYPEDAVLLETIFRILGKDATCDKVCELLDENQLLVKYNELPLVTIYTCIRNAEEWITDCINSVLIAATASNINFEYILIDDYSQDGSLIKSIQQIGLWWKKNFRLVINKENKGLAASSNVALTLARGKYIMRVDADDVINASAIKMLLEKIIKDDAVIVYPAYRELQDDLPKKITSEVVDPRRNHHAGCAMMNKKTINELKFTEHLRHWDSLDLYQKIKQHNDLKISYIDAPLFLYRKHKKSLSASKSKERIDTLDSIVKKYGVKKAEG